jgi:predicted CXXCH cytochrome family protein
VHHLSPTDFQNIDKIVSQFLVRESSNGSLCLACHHPTRIVNGQGNYLAGWSTSVHATATNGIQSTLYVGGYPTVSQNACNSCHMLHNASGPARLLKAADEQDCIACHNGSNLQPAAPNVFSEYAKTGHPFPSANNLHDRSESTLLNNNRHATCVDCHNPHASQQSAVLGPAPGIRLSQASLEGISATDGMTVVKPAINQYDNCFRCHGTSPERRRRCALWIHTHAGGAGADPLNIISQFAPTATSVIRTHDRSSPAAD